MGWLHSFWQEAKKPLEVFGVIVVCVLGTALVVLIVLAYIFKVNVSGLTGKNLWDWLQLLIIPAVLVVGGFLLNFATGRTERGIALDKQREDALQAYIDSISELLLKEHLSELKPEYDAVRNIARVRTLTVLPRLDGKRKASVLQFLVESRLTVREIKDDSIVDISIISLYKADLRGANLSEAFLILANLSNVDLRGADLSGADLSGANLEQANLGEADLSEATLVLAKLREADLRKADFRGADLSEADLIGVIGISIEELEKQAKSIKGATMPDGTKHP